MPAVQVRNEWVEFPLWMDEPCYEGDGWLIVSEVGVMVGLRVRDDPQAPDGVMVARFRDAVGELERIYQDRLRSR